MGSTLQLVEQTPRIPPFHVEAEQSVLGGLMLDNRYWVELIDKLTAEDFYRDDHQVIFNAIGSLIGAGQPCDFVTLSDYLTRAGTLEQAGGMAYIGSLANDTPSVSNVMGYAKVVRERAILRRLVRAGGDIAELGYRPEDRGPEELLDQAEKAVLAIRGAVDSGQEATFSQAQLMDRLDARIEKLRKNPYALAGLSTGFRDLDAKTTGLHPGQLIVVAGETSSGKTSFALNVAEQAALYEKKAVGLFSMEMPADELQLRLASSFCRIEMQKLKTGDLDSHEFDRLTASGAVLREAPIRIDETGALSPAQLRARARRMRKKYGIELLVVDYIQLMTVPGHKENRTTEVGIITRSLKALAKELELPVIALSQINRSAEQRADRRPRISDLRESGSIGQDADLIIFVHRDELTRRNSPNAGTAEIIIAKQRNGPLGSVHLAFLGQYTRFDNLAAGYEPPNEPIATRKARGYGGTSPASYSAPQD